MTRLGDEDCKKSLDSLNSAKQAHAQQHQREMQQQQYLEASSWYGSEVQKVKGRELLAIEPMPEPDINNNDLPNELKIMDDEDYDEDLLLIQAADELFKAHQNNKASSPWTYIFFYLL